MPPQGLPAAYLTDVSDALAGLVARYARTHGPFHTGELAARFGVKPAAVEPLLAALEREASLVRGDLRPGGSGREWCDTEVLRRLRRASLAALRKEVEPVDTAALGRFLPLWHGLDPERMDAGPDRLREAIGLLQGLALPLAQWEEEAFPRRLGRYTPAWLDRLLGAGEVIWVGAGAMGRDGGRVALYLREEAALFGPPPSDPAPSGALAEAIRGALGSGAAFWDDITDAAGASNDEVFAALWSLVWAGEITNDLWVPLRSPRKAPAPKSRTRPPSFGRRAMGTSRVPPGVAGRWSLTAPRFARRPEEGERRRALAELLLERHGVLTRSAVIGDGVPGGFGSVYRELGDLETLGRCRRGYFVEGLGGAQFALPGAIERLRDLRERPHGAMSALVLGAADPAQPFGAALPWPARSGTGRLPARSYGAQVVIVDGRPVAYIERGGKALVLFTDDDRLDLGLRALATWVDQSPVARRLRIERVDGASVFESEVASRLRSAGFDRGAKAYQRGR